MLEIYNEQVRDLFVKTNPSGGLKVRQHPKLGCQVVGLSDKAVGSYEEIDARVEEATANRTVAATQMNATSSRAHTVVMITYVVVEKDAKGPGKDKETKSKINLIDLAGSERAESTGATGDRLKEGAAINLSLTMLGNVITALAEKSNNPKKKVMVPYRESKLTQILQVRTIRPSLSLSFSLCLFVRLVSIVRLSLPTPSLSLSLSFSLSASLPLCVLSVCTLSAL